MCLHGFQVHVDLFRVAAGCQCLCGADMRPGIIGINLQSLVKKVVGILILVGAHVQLTGTHQNHGVFRVEISGLFKQFIGGVEVTQGPHGFGLNFGRVYGAHDAQVTGIGFSLLAGPVKIFTVE